MMERADNGEFVSDPGLKGEKLADFNPGDVGLYGLPNAAVLGGRLWLQVVEVHVARTAIEPDQNDRSVFPGDAFLDRSLLGPKDVGKGYAGHSSHADFHEVPPGQAIAVPARVSSIDP